MRYAHGIIIGAIIPGIIFLGAAAIKIAGILASAPTWSVYVNWFFISIILAIGLPLIIFLARRDFFREFIIYEAGGFGLFTPFWLFFATEISGDSWTDLLSEGITSGLVGPGPNGTIVGIDIRAEFLVSFLILSFIVGVILLRPSFIAKYSGPREIPELTALKESTVESEDVAIEAEMPGVAAPTTTVDSVATLREVLIELGTSDPIINLILNSGIGTTTELVATSPDQLANISGLDRRSAENLLISVQKKLWFSDI
ncbi:MAG: hypothetical protein OEV85_05155 [Candidatus Thorarchaeota archaeon]|nr:hypothetical protein [Candidatus Thorarchaeota archaeon]